MALLKDKNITDTIVIKWELSSLIPLDDNSLNYLLATAADVMKLFFR